MEFIYILISNKMLININLRRNVCVNHNYFDVIKNNRNHKSDDP